VLKRLTAIPIDAFLLALAATVALAALLPAHGAAAEAVSIAAKVAIALLFFLYGTRLSPQQAWHGVRQWRLHLLVLATTFVIFPILGNRSERNRSRPSMRFLLSWDWVRTEVASSGYDFGGPTSTVMMADARYREVQNDRRHGIASAQAICPSKPRDFAMSR